MATRIPAVAYVRMSSKKQDKSPQQQRDEIEKYAQSKGYRILRWYEDSGRSGGKQTEKRTQFLRMIDDAEKRRDFQVIVAWSKSRIDRLGSLEGAEYKLRLSDCGVVIDTITDGGVLDLSTDEGQLLDAVHSLKGHKGLLQISREAIRGKTEAIIQRHRLHGGQPPYGMARKIVETKGREHIVGRGEAFRTMRDWKVTYVAGDETELSIVRWLFETFDTQDVSCHWLARKLNEDGVPSPAGSAWRDLAVRRVLTDESYIGNYVVGKKRTGQAWNRITKDGAKKNEGPRGRLAKNEKGDPAEQIRLEGIWEPVVDPVLFLRAGKKLEGNRVVGRKPRQKDAGYALSGILHCGHCGSRMLAQKKALKGREVIRYNCGRFLNSGTCIGAKIDEHEIIDRALTQLGSMITPDRIREFTDCVKTSPDKTERLQVQLRKLEAQIERGASRILAVESEAVAKTLQKQLEGMYGERERLEAELASLLTPADVPELVEEWAKRNEKLIQLHKVPVWNGVKKIEDPKPFGPQAIVRVDTYGLHSMAVRAAFLEIGLRLDVHWDEREKRTRAGKYELEKVEIAIDLGRLETHHPSGRSRSAPR